jgi:hypothetical protein
MEPSRRQFNPNTGAATYSLLPHIFKKLPFDHTHDLVPVGAYVFAPMALAVNAQSRFKTLRDLVAEARAHPDKITYGSGGPDGLAMDQEGRLLVANPGLGYVWVLNRFAEPEIVLKGPRGASVTNLAFGGSERKTLYCTDSTHGTILMARLDVAGCHSPTAMTRAGA